MINLRKIYCLILIVFVGINATFSQSLVQKVSEIERAKIPDYLKYLELGALFKQVDQSRLSTFLKGKYSDYAAFFGEYQQIFKYPVYRKDSIDYNYVNQLTATSSDYLIKEADQYQVLFINEAHHVPQHRLFITQQLQKLYNKGFRYFASEFILSSDTNFLNQHGFLKKRSKTQAYFHEPLYADMIRQAVRIGFKVVPFEQETADSSFVKYGVKLTRSHQMRDWTMAANLYKRVLKQDPKAKVLVHCGYDHAKKTNWAADFSPMAYYLKKILPDLKLLTVDQTFTVRNEFSQKRLHQTYANRHPRYKGRVFLIDNRRPKNLFYKRTGRLYKRFKQDYQAGFDLLVFHPVYRYKKKRSIDLLKSGRRLIALPRKITKRLRVPYFVEAYFEREKRRGIPVDQIIVERKDNPAYLALPRGTFYIRWIDIRGQLLDTWTKKVR